MKVLAMLVALVSMVGCTQRVFTNLGNGSAVPTESIDKYAREHKLSRQAAMEKMRARSEAEKAKQQAE